MRKDHVHERKLKPGMSGFLEPELILVRGGRNAYLWTGYRGGCLGTLHGPARLRALARAILREVPATKPKKPAKPKAAR